MIFYFSGCGNSRFIAKHLAQELNEKLIFIPDAARNKQFNYTLADNERLGFIFPIYSWQPPRLVIEFVNQLHFATRPNYVWMAATCGDNGGYADQVFQKLLKECGLPLHADFCFVMPNTYINMSFMNIDKPELAQHKIEQAKVHLTTVAKTIAHNEQAHEMRRGIFPKFKTYTIGKNFYRWVSDEPFSSNNACISCGLCTTVCPLQNISLENGRPRWHGHCTNCDACYHHCPQHAIQFGKASKGKGQYHFPSP